MAKHFSKLKSNIQQFVGNQRCKMMARALMVMAVMLVVMVGTTAEAQNKPEIVYLTNCRTPGQGYSSSEMDYYSNWQESQNGQNPEAIGRFLLSNGNPVTWEGQPQMGVFPDGNFFRSEIAPPNITVGTPAGTPAGSGANKYGPFLCFRDNGRLLYSQASGDSCYSIYYCTPGMSP